MWCSQMGRAESLLSWHFKCFISFLSYLSDRGRAQPRTGPGPRCSPLISGAAGSAHQRRCPRSTGIFVESQWGQGGDSIPGRSSRGRCCLSAGPLHPPVTRSPGCGGLAGWGWAPMTSWSPQSPSVRSALFLDPQMQETLSPKPQGRDRGGVQDHYTQTQNVHLCSRGITQELSEGQGGKGGGRRGGLGLRGRS